MNFFASFHFIRPYWFLLLPVIVSYWWYARLSQDSKRSWQKYIDKDLLDAQLIGKNRDQDQKSLLLILFWFLCIVSIAGPTWKHESSPFADNPVPLMLILRTGESMNNTDLIPTRMERSQLKIHDLMTLRKGQPTGLICYSASAHLVLPPTRDSSVIMEMSAELSPEIMPLHGEDRLDEALNLAKKVMGTERGSILLITDSLGSKEAEQIKQSSTGSDSVICWAIARKGSAELKDIQNNAENLGANVITLASDNLDTEQIAKLIERNTIFLDNQEAGTRWAESGWAIVPILVLLYLNRFRRRNQMLFQENLS